MIFSPYGAHSVTKTVKLQSNRKPWTLDEFLQLGLGCSVHLQTNKYAWKLEEMSPIWGTEVFGEILPPQNDLTQGAKRRLRALWEASGDLTTGSAWSPGAACFSCTGTCMQGRRSGGLGQLPAWPVPALLPMHHGPWAGYVPSLSLFPGLPKGWSRSHFIDFYPGPNTCCP